MPLVSSILAKVLMLTDVMSDYILVANATPTNSVDCTALPANISVTFTPCGREAGAVIRMLLLDNPLSLTNFWMPSLTEVLNGMAATFHA